MSSEYIKHNGQKVKKSSVMSRNKKYRYDKTGSLVEITNEADLTADDFVISGSKSTLRRISDIEQNVAMIYTRLTTSDGVSETATSESSDDVSVGSSGKTTRFKGNVVFEKGIYISNSKGSNVNVSTSFADKVINKSNAYTNVSVSNDTLTFTTGEGNTVSVTTQDANTNKFISSMSFNTGTGVLTATRNDGGTVTTDLDGRYQAAGSYQPAGSYVTTTSAQALHPTDALTVSNDTITLHKANGTSESVSISDANTWRGITSSLSSTDTAISLSASAGKSLQDQINGISIPTVGNGTQSIAAGAGLTGGGSFTANQTGNSTVTLNVNTGNGLEVVSDKVQMSGSYTGTFTASGDVCAYSDASLKTNVATIEGALDKVSAVRGVTFERIADGSVSAGVIAQELEAVLPEAVKTDEEGVKMVAYGNITGLLIEAVKELSAQVEELKAKK